MGLVDDVLFASGVTEEQRQAAIHRINADPGVPESASATRPFWLEDVSPTSNLRSESLQEEVDIVFIGSGVTAASITRELLKEGNTIKKPKIVVLDARSICSGATGRNGGHVNEAGFDVYAEVESVLGKDIAAKIVRFRSGHLPLMMEVAQEEELIEESQMRPVESVFAFFDINRFVEAKEALALFKAEMPSETKNHRLFEAEDARKKFLIPDICGAISYTAGAVWPYRLVTGIFRRLLKSNPTSLTGRHLQPGSSRGSEWVAAGFNGEWIVLAWRGGVAVAQMLLEDMVPETPLGWREWFPEQLLLTEERIKISALHVSERM